MGISGMDGGLFEAAKLNDPDGTEYGYVGDIVKTNPQIVLDMLEKGYIPVVTCVAAGIDDTCNYNINADTAAEKLAIALKAKKLIMLTDVDGANCCRDIWHYRNPVYKGIVLKLYKQSGRGTGTVYWV